MKHIPLTQGKSALVDDADFPALSCFNWYASFHSGRGTFDARRQDTRFVNGKKVQRAVLLHRQITKAPAGVLVDHRNGNKLDNRRRNLRLASNSQNCGAFRVPKRGASSEYRGVYWHSRDQTWAAKITKNRKTWYLGYHPSEQAAARAYDEAAKRLFGAFAQPNFG